MFGNMISAGAMMMSVSLVTMSQGVRATAASPNPYLFQSLAVLAADMGRIDEARKWFHKGSSTLMVSSSRWQHPCLRTNAVRVCGTFTVMTRLRVLQGQASHALWQAWAVMEARQGDPTAVRYLFKRGLEASPRSRYLHLAWATWEAEQGRRAFARKLLQRGHEANRRDPAILQVGSS
jgi:hypothetical protein